MPETKRDPIAAPQPGDVILLQGSDLPAVVQRISTEANAIYIQHDGTIRDFGLQYYAAVVQEVLRAMPDPEPPEPLKETKPAAAPPAANDPPAKRKA